MIFCMQGGQSLSSAPTNAIASLALLAIKLRTIPTGSARRTAKSVVTSAIFSSASCSMPRLMRSRSKRASLADDVYCRSLWRVTQPSFRSTLGSRQRSPVIFGQISMKSERPIFHSEEFPCLNWRMLVEEDARTAEPVGCEIRTASEM